MLEFHYANNIEKKEDDSNNLHTITLVWHIWRRRTVGTWRSLCKLRRILIGWTSGEHELGFLHDDGLVLGVFAFLFTLGVGCFKLIHLCRVLPYHLQNDNKHYFF